MDDKVRHEIMTLTKDAINEAVRAIAEAARILAAKPLSDEVTGREALLVFASTLEREFKV